MWKDSKYLIAYLAPIAGYLGLYYGGWWSLGSVYVGFVAIPILETFLPGTPENLSAEEESNKLSNRFFDLLLYLNIPILWGLIAYYFFILDTRALQTYEIIGMTLNVGLIVGTIGINVGHELGHRTTRYEQLMAKGLLLSALYMHFFIEHNRGHHKNVATDDDPASAKQGEMLYSFWFRSIIGGYLNAWQLERERLSKLGKKVLSWNNEMIRFQLYQLGYLATIVWLFDWNMAGYAIAIAATGVLMLESVNYIEHYGLRRKQLSSGRYEPVQPWHSWNSDHELGRIFLYELTRHSDHHFKANRKYQVLRHFEESPQLPMGYPVAILMSFVPPLWFSVMNKKVEMLQLN
ncbi:MAG: alkane 1-monooxygenase [Saprospiraceae bacterium]